MNILITSAGRRTSLVGAFKQAVAPLGGSVFTADMDGLAAAHFAGDGGLRVPPALDTSYIPTLLAHVEQHQIGLLVPTIDTELATLAASRSEFAALGCLAVVSKPRLIDVTADKLATSKVFGGAGFTTPTTWRSDAVPADPPSALICKPRRGSASEGVVRCAANELPRVCPPSSDMVVQEFVRGDEITVDALLDLAGRPLHCVPRIRLRTIGGESVQGVTVASDHLRDWLVRLLEFVGSSGGVGPVTVQAILTDSEPSLIEVNPRFGGGFPLALAAGASYPEWLIELASGREVDPGMFSYQTELYMTRSYSEEFTRRPIW